MPPKRKRKARRVKEKVEPRDLKAEALTREINLSALTTNRYRHFWREMFMRMRMPDIKRKVEITWQTLDHALDFKDYSISLLLDALQKTEHLRRKANGTHMETIDRFLKEHETRLNTVDKFFRQNIETSADKTHEFTNIINFRNEGTVEAFAEDGRNERRLVTTQLQKQLEDLWDNLRSVFVNYRKSTEKRRRAYNTINRKDGADRRAIIAQSQRIANLLEEIAKFRDKINSYKNNVATEMHDITQQSRFFHNVYREANECFILGRNKDKQATLTMCKEYNNSIKHFKSLIVKAERMLVCMQTCQKYETQDEKILPPVVNQDTLPMHVVAAKEPLPFDLVVEHFDSLSTFWNRLGFVTIIATELRMERNRLIMQNNDLRHTVKRWFMDKIYC